MNYIDTLIRRRITELRVRSALPNMLGALIEPPEVPMAEWEAEWRNAEIRAKRLKGSQGRK